MSWPAHPTEADRANKALWNSKWENWLEQFPIKVEEAKEAFKSSNYEMWLTLPGNAGKTLSEYYEDVYSDASLSVTPEKFGAVGDGELDGSGTDDTQALLDWIAWGKANKAMIAGKPGARYQVTQKLWLGEDDCLSQIAGCIGNGAMIIPLHNESSVVSLAGIFNGVNFQLRGWRIETGDGFKPRNGIFGCRVKQSSGVKSSGNFIIEGNYVSGHYQVASYEMASSESNRVRDNFFFNYDGPAIALTKDDLFKDTCKLEYSGATLTQKQTVTVGSASIYVIEVGETGTTAEGMAWVKVLSGTIQSGDAITGGGTVDVTPEVIQAVGTELTIGVEAESTTTYQVLEGNWCNNASDGLFPVIWVDNFGDVTMQNNNLNNAVDGDQIWLTGDTEVSENPPDIGGCKGTRLLDNYLHAAHRTSMRIGSGWSDDDRYDDIRINSLSAGAETDRVKMAHSGAVLTNCNIDVNGSIDLNGAQVTGNNKFRMATNVAKTFTQTGSYLEGYLECNDFTTINNSVADHGLTISNTDNGFISHPTPKISETVVSATDAVPIKRLLNNLYGHTNGVNSDLSDFDFSFTNIIPSVFEIKGISANWPVQLKHGVGRVICRSGADYVLPINGYTTVHYNQREDKFHIEN